MKRNEKLITNKYLEFFVPTVLTAMATNFSAIVDASLVGNLIDSTALSVINIFMPVVQIYAAIAVLFGIAGSVIIASSRGRDSIDTVTGNRAYTVICVSVTVLSAILILFQMLFLDDVTSVLTPIEELRSPVKEYYIPFIIGTPVTLLMSALVHIIRTDNRPRFATWIIVVANTVNLLLDIVFIRVLNLGLTGASLATVIGNMVGLAMVISHFVSKRCTIRWNTDVLKKAGGFWQCFKNVIANGIPGAVGILLTTGKLLFLNLMIQHYGGKAGMVAFSAVSLCQILEGAFVAGGCQSMVPIVSLLYGEKDYNGIKMAFRKAVKILTAVCLAITLIMEIFPQIAPIIYGIRGAELPLAVKAVRISSLMLLGDALTFLFIYLYLCTENKTFSTVISVLNGIVLIIPIGLILAKLYGINGVWLALPVAQYTALLITVVGALSMKKLKRSDSIYLLDKTCDSEVMAFSLGAGEFSDDAVLAGVSSCANSYTAEAVCEIIRLIENAETSPRRSKNTDVRICRDDGYRVFIKCSGAELTDGSFSALVEKYRTLTYSETIGFKQINLLCQDF